VSYQYGAGETGVAAWQDISLHGSRIRLGRYLPPGKHILLQGGPLPELKCRVVWCLPREGSQYFEAGLRIYHTDLDVVCALEAIAVQPRAREEEA
jgi:hypothetical protein